MSRSHKKHPYVHEDDLYTGSMKKHKQSINRNLRRNARKIMKHLEESDMDSLLDPDVRESASIENNIDLTKVYISEYEDENYDKKMRK